VFRIWNDRVEGVVGARVKPAQ